MVATFGKYTSLKASARWESFDWSSCCLLLDVSSLVTTTQNKRPVVFHTVSFATINFHFTLVCCFFLFPFAGLVVGFDLFALRSGRNLFSIADACSGEVWMSLVHNLEPKRRVAALRFPSFLMQNFALCLPKDNFPSIMFLNLNRFPLWRRCVLFTKCFVWLWVSFCFC